MEGSDDFRRYYESLPDEGLLAIKSRRVDRDGTSMLRRRGVSDEEQAAQAEAASLDRAT
jgi:hypothetical protein